MPGILIVEDDPLSQELYTVHLEQEGYSVINAYTGNEALEKIYKFKPDLIILDLALPGIDGRTVLMKLRNINKSLPIIIVSGKSGMQNDPEIDLSPQVFRFFVKPIRPKKLVETVRQILGKVQKKPLDEKTTSEKWIGVKLAGCILEEFLGRGGVGSVFRGTRLGKKVAVKILSENFLTEENLLRFQREAQGLSGISHPNIIKLLGVGHSQDGTRCIVMEFFAGESLSKMMRDEKIEITEVVQIVRQVAEGMTAVHKADIIHRDLKPSNILYNRARKIAKVVDFGLARKASPDKKITEEGFLVGTPYYISPEQCQEKPVDVRSDIYSLGVTFYHLVVGKPPFIGETTLDIITAHIGNELRWSLETTKDVPHSIRFIIEKMMAKDPQQRYQTMEKIAEDLKLINNLKK